MPGYHNDRFSGQSPPDRKYRYKANCETCDRTIKTLARAGSSTRGVWINCYTCDTIQWARNDYEDQVTLESDDSEAEA